MMHCNTHHAQPGEKNCAGWRHIAQNQKTQNRKGNGSFPDEICGQWTVVSIGWPCNHHLISNSDSANTRFTFQLSRDTDKCLPGSGRGAGGWDKTAFPVTKTKIRRPCLKYLVNRPKDGAVGKTEISYMRLVQKFYINQT